MDMTNNDGSLRSVSWRDVCPWTLLFRTFRLSISIQVLVLALIGGCAVTAGWRIADRVFLSEASATQPHVEQFVRHVATWPGRLHGAPVATETLSDLGEVSSSPPIRLGNANRGAYHAPIDGGQPMFPEVDLSYLQSVVQGTPAYALVEPFRRLFMHSIGWDQFFFYSLGGLWTLVVWSLFGGAITRIATVKLGREERVGLRESIDFARRKWASFFGAPLLPLVAVGIFGLPLMLSGVFMRLDLGVLVMGILWPLVALTGLVMALFGIGLLAGWPLMWSTISTEGTDAFDAISRSYAYTYQRPMRYLLYAALSVILGLIGWFAVAFFCDAIIRLIDWAIAWGSGDSKLEAIRLALSPEGRADAPILLRWGASLVSFFTSCVRSFLTAFGYGFFWVSAAGVYLLLRLDVDQTELDDVFLDDEDELAYGLPTLTEDEAGVPGVTDVDASDSRVERSNEAEDEKS